MALVNSVAEYAEVARRDGLLALEGRVANEPNELLQAGLRLLVDGTDGHDAKETLQAMTISRRKEWDKRADFFNKMGGFAPTLGIIGTVTGLIHTLESLGGDPGELGHLIAAAFIATFFGVTFANIMFLPLGAKFKAIGQEEVETSMLVILSIELLANGANPRSLRARLAAHLPRAEAELAAEPGRKSA